MATSKLSTYVEGEDLDENKATVKPARRLYLFQRPLQGHESLSTMSEATQTRGNYTSAAGDPRVDSVLPQITESFHIISHIGVIVIEEAVYADESLTALQKLSTGLVYEHAGPSMRSSQEGAGIHVNEVAIQTFTALDFIGHTDLTNARLDTILRELLRVNRTLDRVPVYHSIYWNCHDVAIRFALLATDDGAALIQAFARLFETAKLKARHIQNTALHHGIPWAGNTLLSLLRSASPLAVGSGIILSGGFSLPMACATSLSIAATKMSNNLPFAIEIYRQSVAEHAAITERCQSMASLEGRFPRLRELGLGSDEWQEMADMMGRTSALLLPALRAIAF